MIRREEKGIIDRTDLQNIRVSFNVTIDEENGSYSYSNNEDGFDNTFIRIFE